MTALTAPHFLIVESLPAYCQHTSAVIGSSYRAIDAGSLAYCQASIARRYAQESEYGNENGFHVAERGTPIYCRYVDLAAQPIIVEREDGMPF